MSYHDGPEGQLTLPGLEDLETPPAPPKKQRPAKPVSELIAISYLHLDISPGHVNLLGDHYWELRSPYREDGTVLNTGPAPREPIRSSLAGSLEADPDSKYYLSHTACLGILRRAEERGKALPPQLQWALMVQAGLEPPPQEFQEIKAYHINQRDEGIDLDGVSGALMAANTGSPMRAQRSGSHGERSRNGMSEFLPSGRNEGYEICGDAQMQTFITQPADPRAIGFDGYNGDLTGEVSSTLGVNCGMSTGRNGVIAPVAFAANQRDEVRDLHDVAGALGAQPGMKQQTFIAGFSAGAGAKAGSIGYSESVAPTLKGTASGNCMPSVLCLNDQGGKIMGYSEDVSGTLRAQEHGHQPLVLASQQGGAEIGVDLCPTITAAAGMSGNNQPVLYENHGIDARYTGPHPVAPTLSARAGTGGNNLPLVEQGPPEAICIMGNAIDRQPHNGGNGIGYQGDVAYTLTATDHHAVFSRQRVDIFKENEVVCTQSARQYKDATDLICRPVTGGAPQLIRRLTPLECERLQGFPDGWTAIPGASDSARYKALGNSVAIPCVEFIMAGIVLALSYTE